MTVEWVAQIARAIATKEQCHYRPASIHAVGLAPVIPGTAAVWVVTDNGVMYRFVYRRVDTFERPIVSVESFERNDEAGTQIVTYWSVPGNIRDIASTIGHRWLGVTV